MNLVIRTIALGCLISLSAAGIAAAQNTPRTKTEKVQPATIAPSSSPKPRVPSSLPRAAERNTTSGNSSRSSRPEESSSPAAGTTRLMPSQTSLRNMGMGRPSTYTNNNNHSEATARTVSRPNKKVAPLKPVEKVDVNWMSLDQAMEKCKTEKRKIFIDVYTDWCGWCKHMDSTTFVDPAVARYLNDHYYPVKFNAEQSEDITFKDKVYHFKKSGNRGYHELAAFWLNSRLSFPTVVFLDENQNLIQPVPGYQDATKMETIIHYFGTDSHRKTPWETYEKNFTSGQQR